MSSLEDLANKLVWWKTPEEALKDRKRILVQVMVYGTAQDLVVAKDFFSDEDFLEVLEDPPSAIFDPRSWAYWNLMYDQYPAKPMPKRKLNE